MELSTLIPVIVIIVGAVLAIVKAVVSLTKSEKDDEVVGKIEKIVRPILNALSGGRVRYGKGDSIPTDRVREGETKRSEGGE
jgi:hypothetical protein